MNQQYDVIVVGAGPGGEVCAAQLGRAGKRVAIVESERVGGECAFWACIPSKVLLRSEEPFKSSQRVPGSKSAVTGALSFSQAAAWRDEEVSNYDDTDHVPFLRDNKVELIRGEARVEQRGVVRVGNATYGYGRLVIATGSDPQIPEVDGLQVGLQHNHAWTPREATAAKDVPKRLAILGGGAVAVEMGQIFARYGSQVTIIEHGPQILAKEEPEVAKLMSEMLSADGISTLTNTLVQKIDWRESGPHLRLSGGDDLEADQVLIAAGRVGRSKNFDAAALGLRVDKGAIAVDNQCRAAENVYAIGDVNGIAMFTHVAKYQGRIAADAILAKNTQANYSAVPRCTFTDPEIASSGITEKKARADHLHYTVAKVDLTSAARASLYYEKPAPGFIKLVADTKTRTLLGASIIGPMASEMIGMATTAIRAKTPVDDLLQTIQPFPTFSEAFFYALQTIQWD